MIENEKCVNCTSCTDVCFEKAIEIVSDTKKRMEHFEHVHLKTCQDCGHSFYTFDKETEKCHVCVNRDPDWLSPY
jgi:Fe-S-cluster-containing hydrogenase component 2